MNTRKLLGHSVFYLLLPLLIFSIGYLRWYFAVCLILFAVWSANSVVHLYEKSESLNISYVQFCILATISLLACFFLGIGGYWTQSSDWMAKNPLLNDLVTYSWPLKMDFSETSEDVKSICGQGEVAFVYYLFYFLPAGLLGKIFGSVNVARFALLLWSAWGLLLLFLWSLRCFTQLDKRGHRPAIFVLLLLLCWGGMDILGHFLRCVFLWIHGVRPVYATWRIEEWCRPYFFQYASNWTSLWWCFNQCIPIWIISIIFFSKRDLQSIGFFYGCALLYSPWCVLGFAPIILAFVLYSVYKHRWAIVCKSINCANVLFPLLMLLVVGTYYMSNNTPLPEKGFFWHFMNADKFFYKYFLFIILEIGFYVWMLRKELKKDILLLASIATLLLLPFYKMTAWNDLLTRGSMPALFLLSLVWIRWCLDNWHTQKYLIVISTLVGSFGSLQIFMTSVVDTFEAGRPVTTLADESYVTPSIGVAKMAEYQFYAHEYEDTFFWKYLAK